jgi:hypothetical protein
VLHERIHEKGSQGEWAREVDGDLALHRPHTVGFAELPPRFVELNPGVVDQDRWSAEFLKELPYQGWELVDPAEIGPQGADGGPLEGERVEPLSRPTADRDLSALLTQELRELATDPTRPTRDEGSLLR